MKYLCIALLVLLSTTIQGQSVGRVRINSTVPGKEPTLTMNGHNSDWDHIQSNLDHIEIVLVSATPTTPWHDILDIVLISKAAGVQMVCVDTEDGYKGSLPGHQMCTSLKGLAGARP